MFQERMRKRILLMANLALFAGCGTGGPDDSGPGAESSVLFDEKYSNDGHFQVRQGADGILSLSVSGRIGEDDPATIRGRLHHTSLLDTYRALKPEVSSPPARLVELEALFTQQLAQVAAQTPANRPSPLEQPKSLSGFLAATCKVVGPINGEYYQPIECDYKDNVKSIATSNKYFPGWLSFAWNQSADYSMTVPSGLVNDWRSIVWLKPWTYTYQIWLGGGYYQSVFLGTHSGTTGNLGLTIHNYYAQVN